MKLWPRCGFVYYSYDKPTDIRRRRCARPWGHWLKSNSPHMGPLITGRPAWAKDNNDLIGPNENIQKYQDGMN